MSPRKAGELLRELKRRGLIEPGTIIDQSEPLFRKTLKGSTLGLASASKPVTRKTAERVFSEFMERVKRVNSDPYFLYKVTKVIIFGSYLTDALRINDLDAAIELTPKEEDPQLRMEQFQQHSLEAERKGRNFDTFVDKIGWPETEVKLFLKSRSRTLSLHPINDKIIDMADHKIVFSE
jgi:predicted nucleotidyltransferase